MEPESIELPSMLNKLKEKYPKIVVDSLKAAAEPHVLLGLKLAPDSVNKVGVKLFDKTGLKELYENGVSRAFKIFLKSWGWAVQYNDETGCSIVKADKLKSDDAR